MKTKMKLTQMLLLLELLLLLLPLSLPPFFSVVATLAAGEAAAAVAPAAEASVSISFLFSSFIFHFHFELDFPIFSCNSWYSSATSHPIAPYEQVQKKAYEQKGKGGAF